MYILNYIIIRVKKLEYLVLLISLKTTHQVAAQKFLLLGELSVQPLLGHPKSYRLHCYPTNSVG